MTTINKPTKLNFIKELKLYLFIKKIKIIGIIKTKYLPLVCVGSIITSEICVINEENNRCWLNDISLKLPKLESLRCFVNKNVMVHKV